MRAVVHDRYGPPEEVLEVREVAPAPVPLIVYSWLVSRRDRRLGRAPSR